MMLQINQTLYKRNKTGSTNQWSVFVEDNMITVEYGQSGGKLRTKTTECEGKNIGKSNETSPQEQARLEATSKWNKQLKKGYVTDTSGWSDIKLAQRVSTYQEHKEKVEFPCYASPKLNGVNGEYRIVNGDLVLLSRGGEVCPMIFHHREDILAWMEYLDTDSLNGEIYLHRQWQQDITGAVKKYRELTDLLEFHIFDAPNLGGTYEERQQALWAAKLAMEDNSIWGDVKLVPVHKINSHEEIEEYFNEYEQEDYEGLIIRNPGGLYKYNEKSSDVFKYKKTKDSEYQIKSYAVDKNGHAVFECICTPEKTFKVKCKGTDAQRDQIIKEAPNWVGKWLKVEYEMLSKEGKPLKPVGLGLRAKTNGVFE